jgi:hypothetical protein
MEELQKQIESYQEVLSAVRRPYQSSQDEIAERLVSRMLSETASQLKSLEQTSVKIHRNFEMDDVPTPDYRGQRARLVPSKYRSGQ